MVDYLSNFQVQPPQTKPIFNFITVNMIKWRVASESELENILGTLLYQSFTCCSMANLHSHFQPQNFLVHFPSQPDKYNTTL